MKKFFKNKPRAIFIISAILVLVLTITAAIAIHFCTENSEESDPNVLAIVSDTKITRSDFDKALYGLNFSGTEDNIEYTEETRRQVLDRLIERVIVQEEANKLGLSVTDEEVSEAIDYRLGDQYKTYTEDQKEQTQETVKYSLLIQKVQEEVVSYAYGDIIVARFDRARQDVLENWEATVESDKLYAKNLIDEIYEDLKSEKLTVEEASKKIDNDRVIGKKKWLAPENYLFSLTFDQEAPITADSDIYLSENFANKIMNMDEGLNEPQVASVRFDEDNESMESFYFIANLEKVKKGSTSYQDWLNQKREEYNVRSYYEKI